MKNLFRLLLFVLLVFTLGMVAAQAQKPKKASDYKIANIKIVPYNASSGEFEAEVKPKDDRSFFNALEIGLFVTVEISGQGDSFEAGRKIRVTVMEGKKVKLTKLEQIGYMGENAKFYYPVWLAPSMCSDVTITAQLVGQKTASKMSRKVLFTCGE
jgi:hypothetical protein